MCGDLTGPFHTLPCVVPVISGEIAGGHAHQGVAVDSGGAAPELPQPLLHVPILTGTAGGLPFPHAWCLPRRGRQPCQVSMTSIQKQFLYGYHLVGFGQSLNIRANCSCFFFQTWSK